MPEDLLLIAPVAASVAAIHTISGPDHYLPFVAMAKARSWVLLPKRFTAPYSVTTQRTSSRGTVTTVLLSRGTIRLF